jgi:hypothetical protein
MAGGDTIFFSTTGSSEPLLPAFASVITKYDKDKDGRLSQAEFKDDPDLGGHFGWLDTNEDGWITAQEWDGWNELSKGEYGAVALKPGNLKGRLEESAVRWRVKKNLPFVPAPLLYQDVFYMARTGGIITSVNSTTGQLLKEGRSRDAMGEYLASPVAADGKIYLASAEGKMTVLKAGAQWEILGVNDLGEEIHATPALNGGRIYVRTRSALYCFALAR